MRSEAVIVCEHNMIIVFCPNTSIFILRPQYNDKETY